MSALLGLPFRAPGRVLSPPTLRGDAMSSTPNTKAEELLLVTFVPFVFKGLSRNHLTTLDDTGGKSERATPLGPPVAFLCRACRMRLVMRDAP